MKQGFPTIKNVFGQRERALSAINDNEKLTTQGTQLW